MPCPDPIGGTITSQSGFGSFAEVLSYASPDPEVVDYQGQLVVTLSTRTDYCTAFRANRTAANEQQLRLVQVKGWQNDPANQTPLPYVSFPMQLGQTYGPDGQPYAGEIPTGAAVYATRCWHTSYGSRCSSYTDREATGGTVTWPEVWPLASQGVPADTQRARVVYDLTFAQGPLAGDVTAPRCVLCATRPSKCSTG